MAKAIAKCTCKTCGKTFIMETVKSSRRDADIWEKWAVSYYDECDDCKQKRREDKAAQLAAEAKAAGLPELTGTPKQLVWAEQLRSEFSTKMDAYKNETLETIEFLNGRIKSAEAKGRPTDEHFTRREKCTELLFTIDHTKNYILTEKADAKWWIDLRFASAQDYINIYKREGAC